MARARTTIGVAQFIWWCNTQLKRDDEYADRGFKSGICFAAEQALHSANAYGGFQFISNEGKAISWHLCEVKDPNYYQREYFIK